MNETDDKNRKEIEAKLAGVFKEKINELPDELREILLDDIVTAFENRLKLFNSIARKAAN